ncbi:helix-turn-helix transcriptional regulator [Rhodococcus erythropolis]|uniref:helix-turn-helix transcriptional regulator n=1 Tax=Rhodococcus erythropolis TaxID=1833 RepID=UPI003B8A8E6F
MLGKRSITADTALRLAQAFGNNAHLWLNIQDRYELDLAADKARRHPRQDHSALGVSDSESFRPFSALPTIAVSAKTPPLDCWPTVEHHISECRPPGSMYRYDSGLSRYRNFRRNLAKMA